MLPRGFPRPPFPFLFSLLAPIAWQLGRPDLFDAYSVGVLLIQLSGKTLYPKIKYQPKPQNLRFEPKHYLKSNEHVRVHPGYKKGLSRYRLMHEEPANRWGPPHLDDVQPSGEERSR